MCLTLLQRYPNAPPAPRALIAALFVVAALSTIARYETAFRTLPLILCFDWRPAGRVAVSRQAFVTNGPGWTGRISISDSDEVRAVHLAHLLTAMPLWRSMRLRRTRLGR
jgi:hypothetical protein